MVTFDPDKKKTKNTWLRKLFSPNEAGNIRRARMDARDLKDKRAKLKAARAANADMKALRRAGILK
jgi:hypothetical protein